MKGVVFTEFLEMVEQKFGMDMVNNLLEQNELSSGGVYSAVGTYHHSEMVTLVVDLSKRSGVELPDLLKAFGGYLFNTFKSGYPEMFASATNGFEFLQSVDQEIHVEVLKLYPDASVPDFTTLERDGKRLKLLYRSERNIPALAAGLIRGAANMYDEDVDIEITATDDGCILDLLFTAAVPTDPVTAR